MKAKEKKAWDELTKQSIDIVKHMKIKESAKPYKCYIVWGDYPDKEQAENLYCYAFRTEAELSAFLDGVDAADGWLGACVFDTPEDHKEWLKSNYNA